MPPTSADGRLLKQVGLVTYGNMVSLAVDGLFYGIYFALVAIMLYILCRRKKKLPSTYTLLAVSAVMFVMTTGYWVVNTVSRVQLLRRALIDSPQVSLRAKVKAVQGDRQMQTLLVASYWLNSGNIVFADAVVLWRAWAISDGHRFLFVPLTFLSASFICAIVASGLNTHLEYIQQTRGPLVTRAENMQISSFALSLATNLAATYIIGRRYWLHRIFMKVHAPSYARKSNRQVEQTLVNLIESGMIYCVFQIVLVALCIARNSKPSVRSAAFLFVGITTTLSAIYPTLIIVFVGLKRSMADTLDSELSTVQGGNAVSPIGPLSFAPSSDQSSVARSIRTPRTAQFPDTVSIGSVMDIGKYRIESEHNRFSP